MLIHNTHTNEKLNYPGAQKNAHCILNYDGQRTVGRSLPDYWFHTSERVGTALHNQTTETNPQQNRMKSAQRTTDHPPTEQNEIRTKGFLQ